MVLVFKVVVYGLVLVVLLPYTLIAVSGMVIGVYRQLQRKGPNGGASARPQGGDGDVEPRS